MRNVNVNEPQNQQSCQTCVSSWTGFKTEIMTEKQKYIGAFLDGYFSDKKVEFGMQYYSMLNNAIDIAEKKWKQYKKQKL